MGDIKKLLHRRIMTGALFMTMICSVMPAADVKAESLSSITEEAQILPIPDGSGKYLMKSDGFYCLDVNGAVDKTAAVHYFDRFYIDGTVFDGYYYHDTDGKFKAGNPYLIHLKDVKVTLPERDGGETVAGLDGYYMVNSLGRLSAASQVRYLNQAVVDKVTFNGFYYFDENGRLDITGGIHHVEMACNGENFDGNYYFGGENGALVRESSVTPEGLITDETGKICDQDQLGMDNLEKQLTEKLAGYEGKWSAYVKNLDSGEEFSINDQSFYSASLIKVFVMAQTYANMEQVKSDEAALLKSDDEDKINTKVGDLLWNMITVSDNESFNELVRLQTDTNDFIKGAEAVNQYLAEEGYSETKVAHTLHPAASQKVSTGERNVTSVRDCGMLLEAIYEGSCVNEEASEAMLDLLLNQEETWKIPEGLPRGIESANKTGETDTSQHDIAIVYGEKTTYILCVMSENAPSEGDAIDNIQNISSMVYHYLNL